MTYLLRFGPYYIEPVIAGLDPKTFEPFICSLDLIGCPMVTEDFVVSGTCAEQMYGMCESLWEPNMVRSLQNVVYIQYIYLSERTILSKRLNVKYVTFSFTICKIYSTLTLVVLTADV